MAGERKLSTFEHLRRIRPPTFGGLGKVLFGFNIRSFDLRMKTYIYLDYKQEDKLNNRLMTFGLRKQDRNCAIPSKFEISSEQLPSPPKMLKQNFQVYFRRGAGGEGNLICIEASPLFRLKTVEWNFQVSFRKGAGGDDKSFALDFFCKPTIPTRFYKLIKPIIPC